MNNKVYQSMKNNVTSKVMTKVSNGKLKIEKSPNQKSLQQDEPPDMDWIGGSGDIVSDYDGNGEKWVH